MFKKVYSLYSAFYPSLRFTLSLQSAFYTQSAVRSVRFTLTVSISGEKWLRDEHNEKEFPQSVCLTTILS